MFTPFERTHNMGSGLSKTKVQLVDLPADSPFKMFGDQYIHPQTRKVSVKGHIGHGGQTLVTEMSTNKILYNWKASQWSLREKKKLTDVEGNYIGSIKVKYFTCHKRLYVLDAENNVRMVVRQNKLINVYSYACPIDIWILETPLPLNKMNRKETGSRAPDLVCRSRGTKNVLEERATGRYLATFSRKLALRDRTYRATVPGNVDCSAIVFLGLCINHLWGEEITIFRPYLPQSQRRDGVLGHVVGGMLA